MDLTKDLASLKANRSFWRFVWDENEEVEDIENSDDHYIPTQTCPQGSSTSTKTPQDATGAAQLKPIYCAPQNVDSVPTKSHISDGGGSHPHNGIHKEPSTEGIVYVQYPFVRWQRQSEVVVGTKQPDTTALEKEPPPLQAQEGANISENGRWESDRQSHNRDQADLKPYSIITNPDGNAQEETQEYLMEEEENALVGEEDICRFSPENIHILVQPKKAHSTWFCAKTSRRRRAVWVLATVVVLLGFTLLIYAVVHYI